MKDYSRFLTCSIKPLMGMGLGTRHVFPSTNLALWSPRAMSIITQPAAVHECIIVHQDHSAKVMTRPPVTNICFDI